MIKLKKMREIKFKALYEGEIYQVGDLRFKANEVCLWNGKGTTFNFVDTSKVELMQFTGFKDKNDNEIFEGDLLTDVVETDEGKVNSKQKVFWNEPTGSWHLDNSFSQDETSSTELWLGLHDFQYEILT